MLPSIPARGSLAVLLLVLAAEGEPGPSTTAALLTDPAGLPVPAVTATGAAGMREVGFLPVTGLLLPPVLMRLLAADDLDVAAAAVAAAALSCLLRALMSVLVTLLPVASWLGVAAPELAGDVPPRGDLRILLELLVSRAAPGEAGSVRPNAERVAPLGECGAAGLLLPSPAALGEEDARLLAPLSIAPAMLAWPAPPRLAVLLLPVLPVAPADAARPPERLTRLATRGRGVNLGRGDAAAAAALPPVPPGPCLVRTGETSDVTDDRLPARDPRALLKLCSLLVPSYICTSSCTAPAVRGVRSSAAPSRCA